MVNYSPTLDYYKVQGSFRYWCQHVLPTVYDDSLSYYELLCKVVRYLNDMLQNLETAEGNIQKLYEAFQLLQDYVNHYFDSTDFQELVNNKLDEMVEDGTMGELINQEVFGQINDDIKTLKRIPFQPVQEARAQYKDRLLRSLASYMVRCNFARFLVDEAYPSPTNHPWIIKYSGSKQYTRVMTTAKDCVFTDTEVIDGVTYNVVYLNCVGFMSLILKHRDYVHSPYYYAFRHLNDIDLDEVWNLSQIYIDPEHRPMEYATQIDFLNNGSIFRESLSQQLANGFAQYVSKHDWGNNEPLMIDEEVINSMETGDIIYLARSHNANVNYYLGIGHCALYVKTKQELINMAQNEYHISIAPELLENDNESYGYFVDVTSQTDPDNYTDIMRFRTLYSMMTRQPSNDTWLNVLVSKPYPTSMNSNLGGVFGEYKRHCYQYTEYLDVALNRTALFNHQFGTFDLACVGERATWLSNYYSDNNNPTSLKNFRVNGLFKVTNVETQAQGGFGNDLPSGWNGYSLMLRNEGFREDGSSNTGLQTIYKTSGDFGVATRCRKGDGTWSDWKEL